MLTTKRDIAYKRIKEMILQGDLTSEFTPSEKSLGDELGMSRTPVREALQRLVMEGFMKGCSHKGSMVNEISIAEAVEIVELRMAVEEFVIQNLSLPLSDEQCAKLQAMVDSQEELAAVGNSSAFLESDVEFHDYLASLYGNQLLRDTLKSARERFLAPRRSHFAQQTSDAGGAGRARENTWCPAKGGLGRGQAADARPHGFCETRADFLMEREKTEVQGSYFTSRWSPLHREESKNR